MPGDRVSAGNVSARRLSLLLFVVEEVVVQVLYTLPEKTGDSDDHRNW